MNAKFTAQLQRLGAALHRVDLIVYGLIGTLIIFEMAHLRWLNSANIEGPLIYAWISVAPLLLIRDLWEDEVPFGRRGSYGILLLVSVGLFLIGRWSLPLAERFYLPAHASLLVIAAALLSPRDVRTSNEHFLQWLLRVAFSVVLTWFASCILAGLGIGVHEMLKTLFHLELPKWLEDFCCSLYAGLVVPVLARTFLPTRSEIPSLSYHPPVVSSRLALWGLMPALGIYLLLLDIYALKILFEWKLPQGFVSIPVTIAFAILFTLEIHRQMISDEQPELVRKFLKIARAVFAPLWILMGIAIWIRVDEHGITEPRFFLMLGYLFMIGAWVGLLSKGEIPLKNVLYAACLYLLVFWIKPLQPVEISYRSQTNRTVHAIETIFGHDLSAAANLRFDNVEFDRLSELRSRLTLLSKTEWSHRLAEQLKARGVLASATDADLFVKDLKTRVEPYYSWNPNKPGNKNCYYIPNAAQQVLSEPYDINGMDHIVWVNGMNGTTTFHASSDAKYFDYVDGKTTTHLFAFDELGPNWSKLTKAAPYGQIYETENTAGRFRIVIHSMSIGCNDGHYIEAYVFYKLRH